MIMELATHNETWVLEKLNHRWLGFEKETLQDYVKSASLNVVHSEKLPFQKKDLFQIILCSGKKY